MMVLFRKIQTALSLGKQSKSDIFIKNFLLTMTDSFTSRNIFFTSEITLYIYIAHLT